MQYFKKIGPPEKLFCVYLIVIADNVYDVCKTCRGSSCVRTGILVIERSWGFVILPTNLSCLEGLVSC